MTSTLNSEIVSTTVTATVTSATLIARNLQRKALLIQNTGGVNVGICPSGGAAVIGGADTITLVPNGSFEANAQGAVPVNAFTVIAASGTSPVTCWEIV